MQTLTPEVWSDQHPRVRRHVLTKWPLVAEQDLEAAAGDWPALLALVQDATGMDARVIEQQLRAIDVDANDDDDTGTEADTATDDGGAARASLAQLRLGTGFAADERDRVVSRLDKLNRRLKRFRADATDLELTVKDRDSTSQVVTLTCEVPGFSGFVASSREHDLRAALSDVREDLWRQIDDAISKRSDAAKS